MKPDEIHKLFQDRNKLGLCGYCCQKLASSTCQTSYGRCCSQCAQDISPVVTMLSKLPSQWAGQVDAAGPAGEMAAQGIKKDTGKPALDLIDPFFEEEVAKVLTFGATKYDVDNWRRGMSLGKAMAGILRHLLAVRKGEFIDPETGLSHLAHACCGLMFIFDFQRTSNFKPDDRWGKK